MLVRMLMASLAAAVLSGGLVGQAIRAETRQAQPGPTAQPRADAKAPKSWPPDAETLRKRRVEAEQLPLFTSFDPVDVTISADFRKVQKDRNVTSKTLFPGTLSIVTGGVAGPAIPIQLRTRGNVRRNPRLCDFAPLRIEFQKADVKGTVFEGQRAVKLGTHCQGQAIYRQYTLKEYLANRIYHVLTPRSIRSRLANVTYVDSTGGREPFTKLGIFFEDIDDVGKRTDAHEEARQNLVFRNLDQPYLVLMSLFEYMIGNTDYSIIKLHNIAILADAERRLYAVPYDFDYSGLVEAHYAQPSKLLDLTSVRERLYRGPCKTEAELRPAVDQFLAKKEEILALPGAMPGLEEKHRKDTEKYLNDFYDIISRPDRVARVFVRECRTGPGM